jgi:hypothetical protein
MNPARDLQALVPGAGAILGCISVFTRFEDGVMSWTGCDRLRGGCPTTSLHVVDLVRHEPLLLTGRMGVATTRGRPLCAPYTADGSTPPVTRDQSG